MTSEKLSAQPDGLLIIDKPAGISSAEAGNWIKRRFKFKKVGHAGTLDPIGTGVLVICINEGTKLSKILSEGNRSYEVICKLGEAMDTQDRTGKVIFEGEVPGDEQLVLDTLMSFKGDIMQIPPMYSAKKFQGKALYKMAREGKTIERQPIPVKVLNIEVKKVDLPRLELDVSTSKGFYVRTLCHDLGEKLGCGGHMEELRRTMHTELLLENAVKLDELLDGGWDLLSEHFLPIESVDLPIPLLPVNREGSEEIYFGRSVKPFMIEGTPDPKALTADVVRALSLEGEMIALMELEKIGPNKGCWKVLRGFKPKY